MRIKKNFSLTKEDRNASRYEERWGGEGGVSCGFLDRPGPAFLAFSSPTGKNKRKKKKTTGGHGHVQMLLHYQIGFDYTFT
jgi:hypothetical protein